MSTHEKLLPCPFCGGEAKPPEEQTAGYWVECTECKSRGSRCFFEIAAIAAWNRRSSPPPAVPDGWIMVPATPTREMIIAHDELQNARGIPAFANSRDIWRAMISAAPAAPNGWQPILKPLEWKDLSYDDSVLHKASWGEYSIIKDDRYEWPYMLRPFIAGPSNFRTLEDAKAAVQADYERRILSALSLPAAPTEARDE